MKYRFFRQHGSYIMREDPPAGDAGKGAGGGGEAGDGGKQHETHVPYERFQEVVAKNKELADKLSKIEPSILENSNKIADLMTKIAEGQAAGKTKAEIEETFTEEEKYYMENKGVNAAINKAVTKGLKTLETKIGEKLTALEKQYQILVNSMTESQMEKFVDKHLGFDPDKPKPEFLQLLKDNPNLTMHQAYTLTYSEKDISKEALSKMKAKEAEELEKKKKANLDTPGVKGKETGPKKYKTVAEAGAAASAQIRSGQ